MFGKSPTIEHFQVISDYRTAQLLWEVYQASFQEEVSDSPCRQNFTKDDFFNKLRNPTIEKFILYGRHRETVGIGFLTNNFSNAVWVNPAFYQKHYPQEYSQNKVYYILGFAIKPQRQGSAIFAPLLYKAILEFLPQSAVWCFDYSQNINPKMADTLEKVGKEHAQGKQVLDQQIYVAFVRGGDE